MHEQLAYVTSPSDLDVDCWYALNRRKHYRDIGMAPFRHLNLPMYM
jgi:hypothetical protein